MVRQEQRSGATLEGRPELKTILDFIHPGETLVVTRIDRLARSMQDLQTIVARLKEKGAHLAATEQPVDTSTATGKAFFDMLGVFAEFERSMIQERVRAGLSRAKAQGKTLGRPKVTGKVERAVLTARAEGTGKRKIAKQLGIGVSTVNRIISEAA